MRRQFTVFLIRWLLNSFGLWLAIVLFGTGLQPSQVSTSFWSFLLAGLIFSVVNSILRPIVIILSLPAILLTLGLFTFIVNGLMVYVSIKLAPGLSMTFWHSIVTGIVLSLINYVVSSVFELQMDAPKRKKEA